MRTVNKIKEHQKILQLFYLTRMLKLEYNNTDPINLFITVNVLPEVLTINTYYALKLNNHLINMKYSKTGLVHYDVN